MVFAWDGGGTPILNERGWGGGRSASRKFWNEPLRDSKIMFVGGAWIIIPPPINRYQFSKNNKSNYYMASSVSGQDEPNRALWLATRAGKMEPSCPLGTTRCIPQAKFHQKPYNKSFIDQVCSVKMAGYWPRSFFASLWTSTSSRSINTQKENLANIQPS